MPPVKKEPETTDLTPAPPNITPEELAAMRRRIEDYEAADLRRETGAFTGIARCTNQGCKGFDVGLPIALRLEVVEHRPFPDMKQFVEGTSEYLNAVDDADLPCPKCGVHRAIMREEPPSYAQLAPR